MLTLVIIRSCHAVTLRIRAQYLDYTFVGFSYFPQDFDDSVVLALEYIKHKFLCVPGEKLCVHYLVATLSERVVGVAETFSQAFF